MGADEAIIRLAWGFFFPDRLHQKAHMSSLWSSRFRTVLHRWRGSRSTALVLEQGRIVAGLFDIGQSRTQAWPQRP
jgi:hypothetical protein